MYVGGAGVAKTTGVIRKFCDDASAEGKKSLVLTSTTTARRQVTDSFLMSDRTPEQRDLVRILDSRHLSADEQSRTLKAMVDCEMHTQNSAADDLVRQMCTELHGVESSMRGARASDDAVGDCATEARTLSVDEETSRRIHALHEMLTDHRTLVEEDVEVARSKVVERTLVMIGTLGCVMRPDARKYHHLEQISFLLFDEASLNAIDPSSPGYCSCARH